MAFNIQRPPSGSRIGGAQQQTPPRSVTPRLPTISPLGNHVQSHGLTDTSSPQSRATTARGLLDSSRAAEAAQLVDAVIPQQVPHESLLKNGATSFWTFLDTATDNSPDALKEMLEAASSVTVAPVAVRDSLSVLSSTLSSTLSTSNLSTPDFAANALSSVREASTSAWQAIESSGLFEASPSLPSLPSMPLSSLAFSTPPSLSSLPFKLNLPDFSTLSASSALLNGTYAEGEIVGMVAATLAVAVLVSLTADASNAGEVASSSTTASDAELPTEYDQEAIYRFWSTRPVTLFKRSVETSLLAAGFLVGLQLDKLMDKEKENEKVRARTLRLAIDRLGPAYIKVAQALSTRVDLLSPAYYEEITLLQDQVAPFPSAEAMAIIEQELGAPPSQLFSDITPEPIAAASLGQVYRAKLRSNGDEVAIKVQRPGVLELVALDLVLGRKGVELAGQLFPKLARVDDVLPVLEEWAFKLYREMDYRKEAATMIRFKEDMRDLSGVLVPSAYDEYTTRRVLCTQWIEGEKLSESRAEDVRELCTTLLNAYLIQLLDTGLLHADPHPGNLIRTPEGKICILDYGLVTEVPPKFRVYILEYMAHLSLKDWKAVGDDFVKLQFIAEGSKHPNDVPGLMTGVGAILELLMAGGGAANLENLKTSELVDVVGLDPESLEEYGFMDGFATVLDTLSNPEDGGTTEKDRERAAKIRALNEQVKFRLPPYFVLILRAFSVIEGIALKVDPQYSIINETFPYLSRRMLTDNSEEIRRALRQVLYGDSKRMDLSRFETLFKSLQNYSTDGLTATPASLPAAQPRTAASSSAGEASTSAPTVAMVSDSPAPPVLQKNTLIALQSVFSSQGTSYIQELLVTELAATVESLSRGATVALLQRALQSSLTSGTLAFLDSLGPMRRVLFPFPLPAEVISKFGSVVTLTEDDHVAINNVQTVWNLLQPQLNEQISTGNIQVSLLRSFASSVGELPGDTRQQLVLGAGRTSQMVMEQVAQRTAARFAQDVAKVRGQQASMDGIIGGTGTQQEAGYAAVPVAMARAPPDVSA